MTPDDVKRLRELARKSRSGETADEIAFEISALAATVPLCELIEDMARVVEIAYLVDACGGDVYDLAHYLPKLRAAMNGFADKHKDWLPGAGEKDATAVRHGVNCEKKRQ